MSFLPWTGFAWIVRPYHGSRGARSFPCTEQFRALRSDRSPGGQACGASPPACRHSPPSCTTAVSRAQFISRPFLDTSPPNERQDWRTHADFAPQMIARARALNADTELDVRLADTAYAFGSSTIDLCLTAFPRARLLRTKAALKLYTLLDLHGSILRCLHSSDCKLRDVNVLDILHPNPVQSGP